ncbi:uncharacterized protein [Cicer arietinum]|uniref:Lysosomal Pro-X carboxypeptidase-like n=1 Tax=Cicer arietinum TaxID=3827 RepID=A0A1S3DWX7_CICAR|nr:lysosomal Pro-X carboxypeptidase-like [Cicer arietinum]
MFGGESLIDGIPDGFMTDNVATFKALLHRYYDESIPFGSIEEAYNNKSTLVYLNSTQDLADYAHVVMHLTETLQTQKSHVIMMGGSYGEMFAAWIRLKYPHIAIGVLSSAPLLYFDNITYYDVFLGNFKVCTEMVMPIGIRKGTMFQLDPFNLKNFVEYCYKKFGYSNLPRPCWITTYYGGNNITSVLQKFASNNIFSNRLKHPYSSVGVLNGLLGAEKSDPKWSVDQRKKEVKIMKSWIVEYYVVKLV